MTAGVLSGASRFEPYFCLTKPTSPRVSRGRSRAIEREGDFQWQQMPLSRPRAHAKRVVADLSQVGEVGLPAITEKCRNSSGFSCQHGNLGG